MMVTPEINHRRAAFVLGRIDEILSWEKTKEQEKDVRFVELGEYLCEVRAKQYWRLESLNSFDEFLEKRFVDSRRNAYYLMAIQVLKRDGWRCQRCGTSKELHVHHLKSRGRVGDDSMHNLITLCAKCHDAVHGRLS
jgi:hypothetical protein